MRVTKVNTYNVYRSGGKKVVGIAEEIPIPEFSGITETVSGPGILGEIDEPAVGHFGSTEIDVNFLTLNEELFELIEQGKDIDLVFRLSTQGIDESNYKTDYTPTRIVIKGKNKGFTGGTLKSAAGTKSSVKVEVLYCLFEVNKKKKFELDKINFVYKVNDKDQLAKVRKQS